MKRRHWLGCSSAIGIIFALAVPGISAAAPAERWEAPAQISPRMTWEREFAYSAKFGEPIDVSENYAILIENLFDPHPEDWADAFVDGDVLVVNTVKYSVDEAYKILASIGVKEHVRVQQVDNSAADIRAAMDVVVQSRLWGDPVVTIGPDWSTASLLVGLGPKTGGIRESDLANKLEASIDVRVPIIVHEAGNPKVTSRYYDTSPFYGGAGIKFSSGGTVVSARHCTSGFAWEPSSAADTRKYMLSAAHCYSSDNRVLPYIHRYNSSGNGTTQIGDISYSSGGNTGTNVGASGDIAIYRLNSGLDNAGVIYVGTYDTSDTKPVVGAQVLPAGWSGSNLWTSGAGGQAQNGTGKINPARITTIGTTVHYYNVTPTASYTNLTVMQHASDCTMDGDSGGAVYTSLNGGGVNAVGIISGSNWDRALPSLTACNSYYTPVGVMTTLWGGSVKLG